MTECRKLDPLALTAMRAEFREASERVLKDAEGFEEIIHSVERLGVLLTGRAGGLGQYEDRICRLAEISPLATGIPQEHRARHMPFRNLYSIVRQARNDAVHQGAYARHLTEHVVQLCLVLEDALMTAQVLSAEKEPVVADFMVRDVVRAGPWEPISFVRQRMLTNSFTFLPIFIGGHTCCRILRLPRTCGQCPCMGPKRNGFRITKSLPESGQRRGDSAWL